MLFPANSLDKASGLPYIFIHVRTGTSPFKSNGQAIPGSLCTVVFQLHNTFKTWREDTQFIKSEEILYTHISLETTLRAKSSLTVY